MLGYASLALGPLGLLEALIVLGILLARVRRFPERVGAYLLGGGLVPLVILGSIVSRMPPCPVHGLSAQCYAPATMPVLAAAGIVTVFGAAVVVVVLRRILQTP